jgi:hypothetical protein
MKFECLEELIQLKGECKVMSTYITAVECTYKLSDDNLTIGKIYDDIQSMDLFLYYLTDDTGKSYKAYNRNQFKIVKRDEDMIRKYLSRS